MGKVIDITSSDIISKGLKVFVKNNTGGKMGMLFVGAKWCGHCVSFKPEYEKFASITGNDYVLYHLDEAVAGKTVLERMGIQGFPSLFTMAASGELTRYTSDRDLFTLTKEFCKRVRTGDVCKVAL